MERAGRRKAAFFVFGYDRRRLMVPGIQQRHHVMRDGTRIGYQVRGDAGRPCVVLANGLGGQYIAFRDLYAALTDYFVICWDYRGLYSSGPSPDIALAANTVATRSTI